MMLPGTGHALSSNNIPLDSPVYAYLEKLVSFGLIRSDFRGIRPFSKAEAARLLHEAEVAQADGEGNALSAALIEEARSYVKREYRLREEPGNAPLFAMSPISASRLRYVYFTGVPRNYERLVHDPGGDGVFGIGSGLRPVNPPDATVLQHGSEGTPFLENNEGTVYRRGSNVEFRTSAEAWFTRYLSLLAEPQVNYFENGSSAELRLNKGYLKLGGGPFEIEVGRDANWFGMGTRSAITLTDNARNLDQVKISSPEPISVGFLGALKYAFVLSRLDRTETSAGVREPYFFAGKVSLKPASVVEIGINLGRQFAGPGVDNSFGSFMRGLVGGTDNDNSNSLAGIELRVRIPQLRNTEIYGEFSGEDAAAFWPIVESYVGGFYVPRLTDDGRNDLRFEYFLGNQILYTNGTFPEGYLYRGLPLGDAQGGATQDFFVRYGHWFSPRNVLYLDYLHTDRGRVGRVAGQALEQTNGGRITWNLPLYKCLNMSAMYGWEQVDNFDLVEGVRQVNQTARFDISYRY